MRRSHIATTGMARIFVKPAAVWDEGVVMFAGLPWAHDVAKSHGRRQQDDDGHNDNVLKLARLYPHWTPLME